MQREFGRHPCASFFAVVDPNHAIMSFDNILDDSQPQTGTFFLGGEKRAPDLFHDRWGNTRPLIFDVNPDRIIIRFKGYIDGAAVRHGLHPVDQQIEKCLIEHILIGHHIGDVVIEMGADDISIGLNLVFEKIDVLGNDLIDPARAPVGCFGSGKV